MIAVPPVVATPVTVPELLPIVAVAGVLLDQEPPPVSVSVIVLPGHTLEAPDIGTGSGFTVTTVVVLHPAVVE